MGQQRLKEDEKLCQVCVVAELAFESEPGLFLCTLAYVCPLIICHPPQFISSDCSCCGSPENGEIRAECL